MNENMAQRRTSKCKRLDERLQTRKERKERKENATNLKNEILKKEILQ
jgi:hypothetical protein